MTRFFYKVLRVLQISDESILGQDINDVIGRMAELEHPVLVTVANQLQADVQSVVARAHEVYLQTRARIEREEQEHLRANQLELERVIALAGPHRRALSADNHVSAFHE